MHCPHEALPPHADGRYMPFSLSVAITELPCGTSSTVSSLTIILTLPEGERYFFAISSITTNSMITARNTVMLAMMKFISISKGFIYVCDYLFESLQLESGEAHECHGHQSDGDECDAKSLKRTWDIRICQFLAYCAKQADSERPANARTQGKGNGVRDRTNILCVGWVEIDALLHEERSTHDGTVYGYERKEDSECGIERRRETLNNHLYQLNDACNDGNEQYEREIGQVDTEDAIGRKNLCLQEIVDRNCDKQHECYCHA